MTEGESKALKAIPIILIIGTLLALAGGHNGQMVGGISLYALCILIAFGINWLMFIPSYMGQGETYFDLTGSITYITVMSVAVWLSDSADTRAILLLILILIWAGRLGSFLFMRIRAAGHDGRFDEIKKYFLRLLMTWTLQGLWVCFSAAAALAAITSVDSKPIGAVAVIGLLVWLVGFGFEAVADRQKTLWRKDPANKGKFITTGLWAWSRHPNYFGEITLWLGIAIIAAPVLTGWQWFTMISPIFVYLLLTRISGVPMLEYRSDEKWGGQADYEAYKAKTPVLIPRPPSE
ncbi:MAG: DUF1295 domain-containing protein [Candidatus Promineifilaceae bacterium]